MGIQGIGLDLGDLEFLRDREKAGELFTELSATFTTTGDKITRTVPSGKTFFLVKASLIVYGGQGDSDAQCLCTIDFDGTPEDAITYEAGFFIGAQAGFDRAAGGMRATIGKAETSVAGKSLVGNGVKTVKINVNTILNGTFRVVLVGWEETT